MSDTSAPTPTLTALQQFAAEMFPNSRNFTAEEQREYNAAIADSEQACCAHLRVSYRTEDYDHDFGPPREDIVTDLNDPNVKHLSGIHRVTRGWWECDFGCGAQFAVIPRTSRLSSEEPE